MTINAFEEFLEIDKEFVLENIPVTETQACYKPPQDVAKIMLKELCRDDMYWDGETLTLNCSHPFPDKFYFSKIVPLNYVWLNFGCGGMGFNPNWNPKLYFVDMLDIPRAIEIERKTYEIMGHYNYKQAAPFIFL